MKLTTYCGHTIWMGHFGMNENGDQGECGHDLVVDYPDEDIQECLTLNSDGSYTGLSEKCPKCSAWVEDNEWVKMEPTPNTNL